MKVVLDTNVLLVGISQRSRLHRIFESLLNQRFSLCVTAEILTEYAEIIDQKMGYVASESVLGVPDNLPTIERITIYYKLKLMDDEDDNKFVDYASAASADYMVAHDKDFNLLHKIISLKCR